MYIFFIKFKLIFRNTIKQQSIYSKSQIITEASILLLNNNNFPFESIFFGTNSEETLLECPFNEYTSFSESDNELISYKNG